MIEFYNPTLKVVKTIDLIRNENPNSSIPEGADMSIIGYFPIVETVEPMYDIVTQGLRYSIDAIATKTGIEYHRAWSIYDLPQEKIDENIAINNKTIKENIISFAEKRLDDFAKERGYDDIKSACSFYGSPVLQYHNDAVIALDVRSRTWESLYKLLNDVETGLVPIPKGIDEVNTILPILKWS